MGTKPNKRVAYGITISHSETAKNINERGVTASPQPVEKEPDRSFAQPSVVSPPKSVTPRTYGSDQEEKDALKKNSTLKRDV
jgi:hypothetical protein